MFTAPARMGTSPVGSAFEELTDITLQEVDRHGDHAVVESDH
jgi:hypothetical protein